MKRSIIAELICHCSDFNYLLGESWRFPFKMKHLGMDDDTSMFCGKLAQMEETLGLATEVVMLS